MSLGVEIVRPDRKLGVVWNDDLGLARREGTETRIDEGRIRSTRRDQRARRLQEVDVIVRAREPDVGRDRRGMHHRIFELFGPGLRLGREIVNAEVVVRGPDRDESVRGHRGARQQRLLVNRFAPTFDQSFFGLGGDREELEDS